MTLIVVGCIAVAVWLLTRTHDITFGQSQPIERDVVRHELAVSYR